MRRWLLAAVLVCAFIILAAYYDANVTYHLDYLRESEVSANYDASVGRNVLISGEVVATGAQSFELKGMYGTYTILSSAAVQRGDDVTCRRHARTRTPAARSDDLRVISAAQRSRLHSIICCAHLCERALFRKLAF